MRRWLKGLIVGLVGIGLSWLFGLRGPVEPPDDVAMVAMDNRTGEQLGLLYLALPFSFHPTFIVLPFATLFALNVAVTASTFKKYL